MFRKCIWLLFALLCLTAKAQQIPVEKKQKPAKEKNISARKKRLIQDPLTPSKATFYSAVVPGLGQVYNGQAWKLPLVYGAMGTSVYFYVDNNKEMNRYRTAYKRRLAGYTDDEFQEIIPENDLLIRGMDFHKNYRDIAMIFVLGTYLLNVLDANVSAHLMQFNVSDDLSINSGIILDDRQMGIGLNVTF